MAKLPMLRLHKIFLGAILPFTLAGCGATDGYEFKGQHEYREREITVVLHPDAQSVATAKPRQPIEAGRELFGFGLLTDKTCEIHVVDPAKSYKPEQLGHELTHCLYGQWHD